MNTLGPWETRQGQSVCTHKGVSVAWCPTSCIVGQDFSYRVSDEEACANARLIAKAPDLKAALAWTLDQIEDSLDPDHQAALAHARSLLED